jgi:hypothetical protein
VEPMLDGPLGFTPTDGEKGTRHYRIEGRVRGVGALLLSVCDPRGSLAIGYTRKCVESRGLMIALRLVA